MPDTPEDSAKLTTQLNQDFICWAMLSPITLSQTIVGLNKKIDSEGECKLLYKLKFCAFLSLQTGCFHSQLYQGIFLLLLPDLPGLQVGSIVLLHYRKHITALYATIRDIVSVRVLIKFNKCK